MTKSVRKRKPEKKSGRKVTPEPKNFSIWIAAAIFILTTIVFFSGQLFGDSYFWEDFTEYVYPVQSYAASEFAHGSIPFWNPFTFSGMPFLADLQVGFFYPLNRMLSLFVTSDNTLPVGALQFLIIIHFFISQISMYKFARYLKISSFGSVIAAISYSFSFIIVCHVIHPMIVYHLAWFPLIVYLFSVALDKKDIRKSVFAGLLFGMTMLSGHPQMTLYETLFIGFLFIWRLVSNIKNKEETGKRMAFFIISGILPFIISVGIFSIQYLPSSELAGLSQRAEMTYENASEGSLEIKQIYSSVVPDIFGKVTADNDRSAPFYLTKTDALGKKSQAPYYYYWETAYYFGLGAMILGLFAMLWGYKRSHSFYVFAAIFGLVYALGSNGFLFGIFYELPFFGSFRNPSRMIFFSVFSMTILSGFGFDSLRTYLHENENMLYFYIVAGVVVLIAFLTATGILTGILATPEQFADKIQAFGVTALVLSLIITITALLAIRGMINLMTTGTILIIVVFIDLFVAGHSFNASKQNPEQVYRIDNQLKERFSPKYPDDIFRINMRMYDPSFQAMKRNQGLISRIMLLEGYNPLILQRVQPPLPTRDDVNKLANVRYQIMYNRNTGKAAYAERRDYLPRAWMVYNAVIVPEDKAENYVKTTSIDFSKTVILEKEINFDSFPDSVKVSSNVKCLDYKPNKIKYHISTEKPGMFCLSEVFYPAWKAYIDGKDAEIYRSNYSYRAVEIPAGEHEVVFAYESDTYSTGSAITLVTLALSIILIIFGGRIRAKE